MLICAHGNLLREESGLVLVPDCGCLAKPWPDPTPAQLESPEFNAIWFILRDWDIHVPNVDSPGMYTGATGNHVRAILDALPHPRERTIKLQLLRALGQYMVTMSDEELEDRLCR